MKKIESYTNPELAHFRRNCNFTPREEQFFDLRAAGISLEDCCSEMGYSLSTINRISGGVRSKMGRV